MSGLWILDPIHNYFTINIFSKRNKNALKGNNAKGLNVLMLKE